jgi:crossover junction endodeoxyribonuclease RuvC
VTASEPRAVRILGIDPGLGVTGYGVVEKRGAALAYVASGRIVSDERQALALRLATILEGLGEVISSFHPEEVAVEKVFVNVNPHSTLQEMVRRLLKLSGVPGTDAADALACAICHAHGGLGAMPTRGRSVRAGRIA